MSRIRSRSAAVVRRRPAARHERAASSHWLRLKMKTIAGSSWRCSSSSTVSTRLGVASTRRPLPRAGRSCRAARPRRTADASRRTASGFGRPPTNVSNRCETVVGPVVDEVAVVEADRAAQLDDRRRRAADGLDPRRQLGRVADRRRQADQPDVRREVDDDLLPHRAAVGVLQEVHLVEHDETEVVERRRAGVDHVAQHLGRHHDDRGVAVDGVVAGQQADPAGAVALAEVAELLVGERLQRCRVERPPAVPAGRLDAVLGDHRLAAAGRRGDDDVVSGVERVERLELEVVERERVAADDLGAVVPTLRFVRSLLHAHAARRTLAHTGQSLSRRGRGGACGAGRAGRRRRR